MNMVQAQLIMQKTRRAKPSLLGVEKNDIVNVCFEVWS